ncbi:MAG: response regulator transcription factor, partial [Clostridium perfringens]|nr:response regulator transcription factor [Clostridium perfringens]
RRSKITNSSEGVETIKYKNLILEPRSREVKVKGEEIQLTSKEFKILELLVCNPKKVFTKTNLFETVWEEEFLGDDNTINVHISNLRNKINLLDNENDYIKTIWGVGFKMD